MLKQQLDLCQAHGRQSHHNATVRAGAILVCVMNSTWYVTFEVRQRGLLLKQRSPRETKTFATEAEAKLFARAKLDEGLAVFAGTINPRLPRRVIPASCIADWLAEGQDVTGSPGTPDGD
ncbi:hypothetical protein [Bradyrhizobium symbiodeficiens]|jgi:hypothetical protein|uniref:hypothetical protein n=1 Tax=Bradyrhizobium symbiodeficiens TaxID=1404367 RepID=UPI003BB12160